MNPTMHPFLVNDPFGDPCVYVDFMYRRRAIMFDLGDIYPLPPKKLLRLTDVFISHTHMDHFAGFDRLLRVCLGRDKELRLYGPPGFRRQVACRLCSYTWNLVQSYETDFTVLATELLPEGSSATSRFRCRSGFMEEPAGEGEWRDAVLREDAFVVRGEMLDHGTPSMAYAVEETSHVNIMKNRLEEGGYVVGPWLARLKEAILAGEPDWTPVAALRRDGGVVLTRNVTLGDLRSIVLVSRGQKIAYATDCRHTDSNVASILRLAAGADYLFIEAAFAESETAAAAGKNHLTARQAGALGRVAGAARLVPFHFSPKYRGNEHLLLEQFLEA